MVGLGAAVERTCRGIPADASTERPKVWVEAKERFARGRHVPSEEERSSDTGSGSKSTDGATDSPSEGTGPIDAISAPRGGSCCKVSPLGCVGGNAAEGLSGIGAGIAA